MRPHLINSFTKNCFKKKEAPKGAATPWGFCEGPKSQAKNIADIFIAHMVQKNQKKYLPVFVRPSYYSIFRRKKMTTPNVNPDRLLRLPEVIRLTGRSRASIYRDMTQGRFPKSLKIGPRAIAWRESAILTWMENLSTQPLT